MEKIAAEYEKMQADLVNKNRARVTKTVLEVGDVGSIRVQGNTRRATDHPWLPIMVTCICFISENNYMYILCTQHGNLTGEFTRGDIYPNETITAEVLRINPMKPNFMNNLTVAKASHYYNALGGATFCKCKDKCSLSKRCCCIALGKLCSRKCHGNRKDGKDVRCVNCPPET